MANGGQACSRKLPAALLQEQYLTVLITATILLLAIGLLLSRTVLADELPCHEVSRGERPHPFDCRHESDIDRQPLARALVQIRLVGIDGLRGVAPHSTQHNSSSTAHGPRWRLAE